MILYWCRADLRTLDNPALSAAMQLAQTTNMPLIACYIDSPFQWKQHDYGAARINFEHLAVLNLQGQLKQVDIQMLVFRVDTFSDIPALLEQLITSLNITHIVANRQYEYNEVNRDRACIRALKPHQIQWHWHHDQCLTLHDQIQTLNGDFYKVYTPYKRAVLRQLEQQPPQLTQLPIFKNKNVSFNIEEKLNSNALTTIELTADNVLSKSIFKTSWQASEQAAHNQLQTFVKQKAQNYLDTREFPALKGTSLLSAYLAVGLLSVKQCWFAHQDGQPINTQEAEQPESQWINGLIWRDYYRYVMLGFAWIGQDYNYKKNLCLQWWGNPEHYARWCEGTTGYPIVDAAMRCLNATHFMHNRLRMVVAMFLVKDLGLDWRLGQRYFAQQLIDADFCSNNGGWQWSAGTGVDAAPYFRIFNPTTQGQRFDADGTFIRQWLPELSNLNSKHIHQPYKYGYQGNYPQPIVDHAQSRTRTLNMFLL